MRFLFACGDIGGANYQLPVIKKLQELGHQVLLYADPEGAGRDVFRKNDISFESHFPSGLKPGNISLIFINTCASATKLEKKIRDSYLSGWGGVRVVFGADGFFNYALTPWRHATDTIWFAIDEGHAQAIMETHGKANTKVRVVGQPAFDSVLDYIPKKEEVRMSVRNKLGIGDSDKVILWWSQGMLDVIYEDIFMMQTGIKALSHNSALRIKFVPRIHPKLNKTVEAGFVATLRSHLIGNFCNKSVPIVDGDSLPGEELCLAADAILSITATEDIKNVMMGGPPVVHMIGAQAQKWFEQTLCQTKPYLSDIRTGQSLVAWSAAEMADRIYDAFNPEIKTCLLSNWKPPAQKATDSVVAELINIASRSDA